VLKEVESQFPKVKKLFTVQDLGGWSNIDNQFFKEGAVFDRLQAKVAKS
jgi:sulfate/thiosulfate transport system substrate-binding protein